MGLFSLSATVSGGPVGGRVSDGVPAVPGEDGDETMNPEALVEGEGCGLEVTMVVKYDGVELARSSAVDDTGRLRLPPRWLGLDREKRDSDLDWWWSEVATVWLEGQWEQWPNPEPKQEALL